MKKIILCMALSFLCLVGAVGSFLITDSANYGRAAWRQVSRAADQLDGRFGCDPRPVPPRERGHHSEGRSEKRAPVPPPKQERTAPAAPEAPADAAPSSPEPAAPAAPAP